MLKLLLATSLLTPSLFAQGSTTFDVAAIHRNKSDNSNYRTDSDYTTFTAVNTSLEDLLRSAYDLRPDQIIGIPPTMRDIRYDLNAKVVDPDLPAIKALTDKQQAAMLIPILQDRFALKAHFETRILPTFDLVTLPGTAKLIPLPPVEHGGGGTAVNSHAINATAITLDQFSRLLGVMLNRAVVNRTDLAGRYSFSLKYSPIEGANPDDPNPPLITAIQQELGLKLKSSKGPVPVLIVDQIQPPTEN